ncbi:hypothetical protein Tco_0764278 [Tanacetum coccineum]
MDIIHPEPVAVVAFPAATVVRTLAQHGEAIRGIQEQLVGVPIQEELMALRFRIDIAEAEIASLRARNKTTEAIKMITRNHERQAREKMDTQLEFDSRRSSESGFGFDWWNGQVRNLLVLTRAIHNDLGRTQEENDGQVLSSSEIQKLEIKLWNLKVKGNDVPAYTKHFQELTLICTKSCANENEKVNKYTRGLPDNIYGNVKSSKPKTLDETIELANDLMDQKLRTYAERQSDNKRKADDSSRNNYGHQQQPFKRQNVTKVYNMGTGERKPYEGSLPKCTKCHLHHNGPCTQRWAMGQLPKEMVVLSVEHQGISREISLN